MECAKCDVIANMSAEELEEYQLNCEVYRKLARNMMDTAYEAMDADNCWVFGCSYFPDSIFLSVENYAEPIDASKETITSFVNMDIDVDSTPLIFDETTVDMTRPFCVQTAFILHGIRSKFITIIQYLD